MVVASPSTVLIVTAMKFDASSGLESITEISVDLIPETLRLTTWASVQVGDAVNYEIDQMTRTMVDTLESIHQR